MIRLLRRAAPYIWMGVIFCVSHSPSDGLPNVNLVPHFDKVIHAGVYAFLVCCFAVSQMPYRDARVWLRWAAPVAVAYAISDEVHQSFVPGRNADVADVIADVAGVALASVFFLLRSRGSASEPSQ
ncbi:MAG: VanZ family protein [Planctomycetota bacterium]